MSEPGSSDRNRFQRLERVRMKNLHPLFVVSLRTLTSR